MIKTLKIIVVLILLCNFNSSAQGESHIQMLSFIENSNKRK